RQQASLGVGERRESSSDMIEARANISAKRILNSVADSFVEEHTESPAVANHESVDAASQEAKTHVGPVTLPPASESGLVSPDLTPDESQVTAVNMLCQQQYGSLIGAAGSGKTTSQK